MEHLGIHIYLYIICDLCTSGYHVYEIISSLYVHVGTMRSWKIGRPYRPLQTTTDHRNGPFVRASTRNDCRLIGIYIYMYIYIYIHYITLHYTTLHYITLHYITLHYITLHYVTWHYIHCIHTVSLHTLHILHITLHCIHYIHYIRYIHTVYKVRPHSIFLFHNHVNQSYMQHKP